MTSEGLLGRAATFSIAALVHLIFLSAFLGKIRVGLPVLLHPDAHPSDRATPIIAYIVSSSTNGTRTVGSSPPTLEANQLVPVSQKFDVPTPTSDWPNEDNASGPTTQPAPPSYRHLAACLEPCGLGSRH